MQKRKKASRGRIDECPSAGLFFLGEISFLGMLFVGRYVILILGNRTHERRLALRMKIRGKGRECVAACEKDAQNGSE